MSVSLRDILVVCDLDGTLLDNEKQIERSNLETIKLFTTLGGHFTVATGRTFPSVALYPELVPLIDPAITSGGCVLYDFKKQAPAKSAVLPHLAAQQALRHIAEHFPTVGVMVMADDMRLYQVRSSERLTRLIHDEDMAIFSKPSDCLPKFWNKMLLSGPQEQLAEIQAFVKGQTYPGIYFVLTGPFYYEMMPKGVSKGSALHELCGLMQIKLRNTYAIGDYYNDLEMMRQAGYAVAMGNAPDEVKRAADEVIDTNLNSGVGQFLYRLIQQYG